MSGNAIIDIVGCAKSVSSTVSLISVEEASLTINSPGSIDELV